MVANRDYVLPPNERFISMVFQSYALWPHMSVQKNVAFPIKNSKFVSAEMRSNCNQRVSELINILRFLKINKSKKQVGYLFQMTYLFLISRL